MSEVRRIAVVRCEFGDLIKALDAPYGTRIVGIVPQSAEDLADGQVRFVVEGVDMPKRPIGGAIPWWTKDN